MGKTTIAWTDFTFNGWIGCEEVSPGCDHCYARTLVTGRMGRPGTWGPARSSLRQVTSLANWKKPLAWNRAALAAGESRRVFAFSLADVFEKHPTAIAMLPRFWELVRATPALDWLILTKRANRIAPSLPPDWGDGYPNAWLGVTIEDDAHGWRAEKLRRVPAVVRFISYEPALGELRNTDLTGIHWIIYGGESGPGHRPDDVAWAAHVRERCRHRGMAFFYKQSSGARAGMNPDRLGGLEYNFPRPRRVFPAKGVA